MTRDEALRRLCALQEEVYRALGGEGAADCFCGHGGFWHVPQYANDPDQYRNDGAVIEFIESAARDALAARTAPNGGGDTCE